MAQSLLAGQGPQGNNREKTHSPAKDGACVHALKQSTEGSHRAPVTPEESIS